MASICLREGIQKAYLDEAKLWLLHSWVPVDIIKFVRPMTPACNLRLFNHLHRASKLITTCLHCASQIPCAQCRHLHAALGARCTVVAG